MIKTLIFDLDGTLLNTLVDLAGACNLALKKFNFPTHPVDDYRYFIGQGVRELARKMLPKDLQNNDVSNNERNTFISSAEKIIKLKELLDKGIISQEVFDEKSKKYIEEL